MQTWQDALSAEKEQPYFQNLLARIKAERAAGDTIYPPAKDVFNAFKFTEFDQVRVVILGQDPYHNVGQAHGLAFSVQPEIAIPPSLLNMYKELADDIPNFHIPQHGNLNHWAEQGVLLLNTVLTVRAHQAHSHANYGWETFTDKVIEQLNQHREHVVFLLWGSHAQKKGAKINRDKHLVLTAPHPSPLSAYRGFFGCQHFSQTNDYLVKHGFAAIDWQV
ncbi:uracil-DNA glycosylase [Neisseriaceae bacterium B1]